MRQKENSLKSAILVRVCGALGMVIMLAGCQSTDNDSNTLIVQEVPDVVDFNLHIKPILSDRCYKCHGPDENARKADLRFDLEEVAFAILDSVENTYAIFPGSLKKSQLAHRISSNDPEYMMPPPESNLSLSDHEITLLKKWIEQGAEWKPHWSFIPPEKPALPVVSHEDWPRNPIDNFTIAKMAELDLNPAEEAEKTQLIRRLSFDLTGLPPKLEEVEAFISDESPTAYERMVDHYLNSTAYGERMAVPWLDLARYADTHGYQDDLGRTSWPWRDWVIDAFNRNMSFDQFTTWQLAGDLLPDPTYEQKLATAFNRNHPITQEGGVVPEEYRVEYVADRTQTIATTFLGLTMQCARCHDHKFDPVSQKEFYELFAFNNSVPEKGQVSYQGIAEPSLPLHQEKIDQIIDMLKEDVDKVTTQLEEVRAERVADTKDDFEAWRKQQMLLAEAQPAVSTKGLMTYYNFDYFEGDQIVNLVDASKPGNLINGVTETRGKFSGAVEFNGKGDPGQHENYINLGDVGDFGINNAFTFSFWINYAWANNFSSFISRIDSLTGKGYQVVIGDRYLQFEISNGKERQTFRMLNPFAEQEWMHVAISYDGSGWTSGFKWYFNGNLEPFRVSFEGDDKPLRLNPDMRTNGPMLLGKEQSQFGQRMRAPMRLDELRIYNRALSQNEITALTDYDPVAHFLNKKDLSTGDRKSLLRHYLHNSDPDYQAAILVLGNQKILEQQVKEQLQPVMIMQDMDTVRPAYVLNRGAYDAPEERVYPGTPGVVMDFSEDLPANRLGLAQWLLDPKNPLTSRVIVNRFWQMTFGEGIVHTLDDFGSQGALPTHPQLLDWLAVEFIDSGWNVKHLLKLMVTSATYRQSSRVDPKKQKIDPQNVYLSRAPQYRLPAELVRDNVLALSGLLVEKIGGPSVKPYQPPGLWEELSCGRGTMTYFQENGEELYRKSLYTFWKRTVPPPSMITFDAATRNYCVPKRQTTSTPLQALVLLNDPQVLEAARVFGERMMKKGGDESESRIAYGFRIATSRSPKNKEMTLLNDLFKEVEATYQDDLAAASDFLSIGEQLLEGNDPAELAAYTQVAHAIFNLDETITKY
ncbi:MAG: DUF1553 domain-containing protein [Cyclobacteriaceae bacterium]